MGLAGSRDPCRIGSGVAVETVSFETGVAALQTMLDYPYPIVKYAVDSPDGDTTIHHVHGFGGREVHLSIERGKVPVYSAEVAFFRRFECNAYEKKGAVLDLFAAADLMDELLDRVNASM